MSRVRTLGDRIIKTGYVKLRNTTHPRTHTGYVLEHLLVVEKALGHFLTLPHLIHHINTIRDDNRNNNLCVLENNAEHVALHRRMRVQQAGGNPWTQRLCSRCRLVKNLDEFGIARRNRNNRPNNEVKLQTVCKVCNRLNAADLERTDPALRRQRAVSYRLRYPERVAARRHRWYLAQTPAVRRCRGRVYYAAHREEVCRKAREKRKMSTPATRARTAQYMRTWRAKQKEKMNDTRTAA